MSKELLDNVSTIETAIKYLKGNPYIKNDSYSMEALYYIEKALTPPTADEVSKALSEIEGLAVRYEANSQAFINKHDETLIVMVDSGVLFRCDTLPPHLITLIGRFYESLEEVVK